MALPARWLSHNLNRYGLVNELKLIAVDRRHLLSDAKPFTAAFLPPSSSDAREQNIRSWSPAATNILVRILFPEIAPTEIAFVAENWQQRWGERRRRDVFACRFHFNVVVDHQQTLPNIESSPCMGSAAPTPPSANTTTREDSGGEVLTALNW